MLYNLTSKAYELYEQLSDPEIELPEEQLQEIYKDTLEANGESYLIDRTVELIRNFEADAEAAKNEKDFFYKKQKTAENAVKRLKAELMSYLIISNQKKVKTEKFSVTKSQSQSVYISDENLIPEKYLIEQAPKIDKMKIKADLKEEIEVTGAELKTSESIRIRWLKWQKINHKANYSRKRIS